MYDNARPLDGAARLRNCPDRAPSPVNGRPPPGNA